MIAVIVEEGGEGLILNDGCTFNDEEDEVNKDGCDDLTAGR